MARGFLSDNHWPNARDEQAQRSDLIDIAVELVHETEKAWLVHDGQREAWISKSGAELSRGILTLPRRLALEKTLI